MIINRSLSNSHAKTQSQKTPTVHSGLSTMSHHLIAKSGIGQPWILKKLKRLSKLFLSIMIVPILLFLMMLLSGCTTIQKEYVPVEYIAIPAHLTADCLLPYIPEQMTWGESLMLNISLLSVIDQCNSDKKAIREIEKARMSPL